MVLLSADGVAQHKLDKAKQIAANTTPPLSTNWFIQSSIRTDCPGHTLSTFQVWTMCPIRAHMMAQALFLMEFQRAPLQIDRIVNGARLEEFCSASEQFKLHPGFIVELKVYRFVHRCQYKAGLNCCLSPQARASQRRLLQHYQTPSKHQFF